MLMNTTEYLSIIENIKSEIRAAQYRATIHANSDLLYEVKILRELGENLVKPRKNEVMKGYSKI